MSFQRADFALYARQKHFSVFNREVQKKWKQKGKDKDRVNK